MSDPLPIAAWINFELMCSPKFKADIISDIILVAVPVQFLRDVRLPRDCRILVFSAFSASLLISGVTILHSVLLFQETTSTTIIIGHVKVILCFT